MLIKVLAFGIVKDIFSGSTINVELNNAITVDELKILLEEKFPGLKQLSCYMIAVNNEYAQVSDLIQQHDEIAIIPPVSGG